MADRIWIERIVIVLLPAAGIALACDEDEGGGSHPSPNCPGASTACPDDCQAYTLPALTPAGCLEPQIASCQQPKPPYTKDAGCVKRDADSRLFQVMNGGWPTVDGFDECSADENGQVMSAPACP